jgi:hypothetical protein
MFPIAENMRDCEIRFPAIKIIHQAAMFRMPSGEMVQAFTGIMLDVVRTNAFWAVGFDESGGGTPPTCNSVDGIKSDPLCEGRQSMTCHDCPQNAFGSDGRGKSCKNLKQIYIVMPGELIPNVLTVPPTNLKAVDLYVGSLSSKKIPYQLIETNFGLKITKNKDGIEYSELILTNERQIQDMPTALNIKAQRDQWTPMMRKMTVTSADV